MPVSVRYAGNIPDRMGLVEVLPQVDVIERR